LANLIELDPLQPRILRYRGHYRIYLLFLMIIGLMLLSLWIVRIFLQGWQGAISQNSSEMVISLSYFFFLPICYFFWLRPRINHSVQVFENYLKIHKGKHSEEVFFENIESVSIVAWSLFYIKMNNGHKHYFNADLERVDYVWEGIKKAHPELIAEKSFQDFRTQLVKYDHHQKRKEWFFRHKLIDVVNWIFLPFAFLGAAYLIQSQEVIIHHQSLYFFRLLMYALLVLLVVSLAYSQVLKKLIFDRKFAQQNEEETFNKVRDIEFEGVIIQRSKIFQLITVSFLLALVVKGNINFYSLSKTKADLSYFNIPANKTLLVDNRFNCINCRYQLHDGDMVIFGKGLVGQILAKEGEPVGEVIEDTQGRTVASLSVREVPKGHVAVKSSNGKDIIFIKIVDLIGKIEK
jgi:hypothetical protein